MRVLLGQLEPVSGDVRANAAAIAEAVAACPTADLAVFPELVLCGYALERTEELAVDADGPELAPVADAAAHARTAVIAGFAERVRGGVANAAGDALCVTEVAGMQAAPLICFDVEFPEPARAVSRAGAELLVTIAANMEQYADDHALAVRARALDNRRPHVYVNRSGSESGLRFCGSSAAVTAAGRVVAAAGAGPALLEVELDVAGPATSDVDYLSQIRSGLDVERPHLSPTEGGTR